jgi:hypothetical protein
MRTQGKALEGFPLSSHSINQSEIKREKLAFLFTEILQTYFPKSRILIYRKLALLFTDYRSILWSMSII